MRIGISVLAPAGRSVWDDPSGQNVYFLAQLLRTLPFVTDVVLLHCGHQSPPADETLEAECGLRFIGPGQATDLVDVVFEMGAALDVEWLDYLRALGKKVVLFHCGQPYVDLIEPSLFKRDGCFSRASRCDEIWVFENNQVFSPMLRSLHRCPVIVMPYLWDPIFVERSIRANDDTGLKFGYSPKNGSAIPRALRTAIFETNRSVVSCCTIPLLVSETAYRAESGAIDNVRVLNGMHMRDHRTFASLTASLTLETSGKLKLDEQSGFVPYVSEHVDAIVAHQWMRDHNGTYLEALYGGYPLIHNSSWLRSVGYFYPDSDVAEGARQLIQAARFHDEAHADYRARARAFTARLCPTHESNRTTYSRRLLALSGANQWRAAAWGAPC